MTNQRNVLIQAAIKAVRLHGMDGVRMQHIGQIAHATPSSIYLYFKGKDELLRVCYEQIDHEIARIFGKISATPNEVVTDPEQVIHEAWTAYWKWLLSHPDETIFFHYYRDWSGFPEYDMHRDVSHFCAAHPSVAVLAGRNRYVRQIRGPGSLSQQPGDGECRISPVDGRVQWVADDQIIRFPTGACGRLPQAPSFSG